MAEGPGRKVRAFLRLGGSEKDEQRIYFPPALQAGTNTHVGPFLTSTAGLLVDPVSGNTYIGDPRVATAVVGSPFGTNFVTITGTNIGGAGVNTITSSSFNLSGRVSTGPIATLLTLDKITYARTPASGQIDAFVTALPTATLDISGTGMTRSAGGSTQPRFPTGSRGSLRSVARAIRPVWPYRCPQLSGLLFTLRPHTLT